MRARKHETGITEPRTFNHITIDRREGRLTKKSDSDSIQDEKRWYAELPEDLAWVHPRIYSLLPDGIEMEYLDYPTAHSLYMSRHTEKGLWEDIFAATKYIQRKFAEHGSKREQDIQEAHRIETEMYVDKVEKRLKQLLDKPIFRPIYAYGMTVNGKEYVGLCELTEIIRRHSWRFQREEPEEPATIIHGDLHLGNMLVGPHGTVKLVDPRGKFGPYVTHGDSRYDIAKMMHSIEGGYDLITEDEYGLRFDERERKISYRFGRRPDRASAAEAFEMAYWTEINADRVALWLIEATLFLSMTPLHRESTGRQLMMLARGYELAEKALGTTVRTG